MSFVTRDVEDILNAIRPALLLDGGNVRLVTIEGNNIQLEILGSCKSCSSLPMTKKYGIEAELRKRIDKLDQIMWKD